MRPLFKLAKALLVLALVIPVAIIALFTALGILGAVFGLAVFALRIAVVGLLVWGAFRLVMAFFGSRKPEPVAPEIRQLPPVDPHYEAAMRELDRELGVSK